MLILATFWLLSLADLPDQGGSRLAIIRPAPDFALVDHNAKPVRLSQYRGKVVFVSFIFTTCNGTCPATTHRLAKVHDALAKHPDLLARVHFVSITLDPARDVPEMLRGYMRLYDLDDKRWTFLTGSAEEVAKVHAAWGMWAKPGANGQLDHPSRIHLVDGAGNIREIYNLDFLRIPWVVDDVKELLGAKR